MNTEIQHTTSTERVFRACVILTLIYITIIFLLPDNKMADYYNFTANQYHIALVMINLPLLVVWYFAFWGYVKLRQYAHAIRKTPEGPYFEKIAVGLSWLAWSLPVTAITQRSLNGIAIYHRNLIATTTIIGN